MTHFIRKKLYHGVSIKRAVLMSIEYEQKCYKKSMSSSDPHDF